MFFTITHVRENVRLTIAGHADNGCSDEPSGGFDVLRGTVVLTRRLHCHIPSQGLRQKRIHHRRKPIHHGANIAVGCRML